jgi:hypothetical protein
VKYSQLITLPAASICFIFSTRRARVSSFFASEYQTMNSFLCVKDKLLSFWVNFVPSPFCRGMGTSIWRFSASVITSKPANGDQVKTGQRERPGQNLFYSVESFGGKLVFVRQLRGPHLSTCP